MTKTYTNKRSIYVTNDTFCLYRPVTICIFPEGTLIDPVADKADPKIKEICRYAFYSLIFEK